MLSVTPNSSGPIHAVPLSLSSYNEKYSASFPRGIIVENSDLLSAWVPPSTMAMQPARSKNGVGWLCTKKNDAKDHHNPSDQRCAEGELRRCGALGVRVQQRRVSHQ
jgi:hypothetical protein